LIKFALDFENFLSMPHSLGQFGVDNHCSSYRSTTLNISCFDHRW
jgi:hypothetical protein